MNGIGKLNNGRINDLSVSSGKDSDDDYATDESTKREARVSSFLYVRSPGPFFYSNK